jgi:hypothetical protein
MKNERIYWVGLNKMPEMVDKLTYAVELENGKWYRVKKIGGVSYGLLGDGIRGEMFFMYDNKEYQGKPKTMKLDLDKTLFWLKIDSKPEVLDAEKGLFLCYVDFAKMWLLCKVDGRMREDYDLYVNEAFFNSYGKALTDEEVKKWRERYE